MLKALTLDNITGANAAKNHFLENEAWYRQVLGVQSITSTIITECSSDTFDMVASRAVDARLGTTEHSMLPGVTVSTLDTTLLSSYTEARRGGKLSVNITDTPILCQIEDTGEEVSLVFWKTTTRVTGVSDDSQHYFVFGNCKTFARAFMRLEVIRKQERLRKKSILNYTSTWCKTFPLPEDGYDWSRVVVDEQTRTLTQVDFERFLSSKEWFTENKMPYRRGYLFYGMPGNGKTSVVRTMCCHPDVTAVSLDLGDKDVTNTHLTTLFEVAANNAPCVVILEDLDRLYTQDAEKSSKLTLQHLLNTIDGASSADGVIVVATANDPSSLDPALMSRPGRFDRVVEFKAPAREEIRRYFANQKCLRITEKEMETVASLCSGYSYAQLKEVTVLAGTMAFDLEQGNARYEHLKTAIKQLKDTARGVGGYRFSKASKLDVQRVGFGMIAQAQE